MKRKRLPIGVEDFKELITGDYYYVDKTDFIAQTFNDKAVLYTRPRRFGKTLNMSMLKYFYSIKEKPELKEDDLFKGLRISEVEEAKSYKNRYPVISLSLKDVEGCSFGKALDSLSGQIADVISTYSEVLSSQKLTDKEIKSLKLLEDREADEQLLKESLLFLSKCLYKHFGQKVVILIDEYDVPLDKAYQFGYYDEMIAFFRSFLSRALKSNLSMEKGILTGCLRIPQESVFTELNNLSVYSVMDPEASSFFGFTSKETQALFQAYGFSDKLSLAKEWYGGYLFGKAEIYNPWSGLRYLKSLTADPDTDPLSYWAATSSNYHIQKMIQNADPNIIQDLQDLADGKTVTKRIFRELTYKEIEQTDKIYSLLLLTGYLKALKKGKLPNTWELAIPNHEVREIYEEHFLTVLERRCR